MTYKSEDKFFAYVCVLSVLAIFKKNDGCKG